MPYSFRLGNLPVEVEYKNTKTVRITVYHADGRVKITAPPGTESGYIRNFAASKTEWIKKQLEKSRGPVNAVPLRNNSTVYIWGEAHTLEIIEREGNASISVKNGTVKIRMRRQSPKAKIQEVLDGWYRRSLKKTAPALIEKWEKLIGVTVNKLYVRKMKTHWGSCNFGKQTLRLNSELAKRSPAYLEYVIIHEMLHIIEKGHNKDFYRLLEKYVPNWKILRKNLNKGEP